jgi:cyclophilin family peptidyl-prolyl cis-trans isomerase
MKTTNGTINILLETEKAPITTTNFIGLAKQGYYDGVIFHRIIKDFMIQ